MVCPNMTAQKIEEVNSKTSETLLGHMYILTFAITLGSWKVSKGPLP